MTSIHAFVSAASADAPAIGAPARPSLCYGALADQLTRTQAALNRLGVGRGDRVAIVLPNGPEMATAFLSVAASASAAPLNPGYTRDEFAFYLEDLRARIVFVEASSTSPVREAAAALSIPVVEIIYDGGDPAGSFSIGGYSDSRPARSGWSEGTDEALVLHTSGTTSRPKLVPLSTANILASARNVAASLRLGPEDTGLSIMPLFHIHGLIASLLSSISAGAHVVCTPGFNALKFYQWFDETRPSWYTAVPTMHQAILARAARNPDSVAGARLRFVRSSSSSLPPPVMAELESTFGCPVIEAYGMTEAAHQMASNPLPPAPRKPGTVGIAAGPEVAIMDEASGTLRAEGEQGEIVIRGPNVFAGYEANPDANASAFTDGWFRTGDLGSLDAGGYLTISGRLKEIINRGGEKIAPREVDDVLQAHPAVDQVVTFALPHDKLGETVAAVVVFREGLKASEGELKDFAAERLAAFKVPQTILFRDEIPKGATGKLQRIGLAEKLGL